MWCCSISPGDNPDSTEWRDRRAERSVELACATREKGTQERSPFEAQGEQE